MNENLINRLNILYVESREDIKKPTSELLRYISKKLFNASNGREGIEIIKKEDIDLIISDINLSDINGLEFLIEAEKIRIIPSLIISQEVDLDLSKFSCNIIGLRGLFIKPFNQQLLLKKIDYIIQELTEKKEKIEQEKILQEYKNIVDKTISISKTDKSGIITYANEKFVEISGYSKSELIGKPHSIIKHPDSKKELFKELWDTILDKRIWKGIVKNKKKDGSYYYVSSTIIPVEDLSGEIKEFVSLRKDVTKQKETEEELNKSNHFLKEYEEKIKEVFYIFRFDLDLNIKYFNKEYLYNIEEKLSSLYTNKERFINKILKKDIKNIELKINNKVIDFSLKLIKNQRGKIIEIMAIGKDVSEILSLKNEVNKTQKEVILALGTMGEKRSEETGNHVKRVGEYSYLLARLYGLPEVECRIIKDASPMHDIGKVAIPDSILNKKGKLTEEEYDYMKNHAQYGYEMLKNSERPLLKASAVIAYEHHEKWNGKGYPRGLKGEEIHIYGRIVAIADVFDALSCMRIYKKAWETEDIIKFFKDERNEHFQAELANLLLDNIDDFINISKKYKD